MMQSCSIITILLRKVTEYVMSQNIYLPPPPLLRAYAHGTVEAEEEPGT